MERLGDSTPGPITMRKHRFKLFLSARALPASTTGATDGATRLSRLLMKEVRRSHRVRIDTLQPLLASIHCRERLTENPIEAYVLYFHRPRSPVAYLHRRL